jgi:arylsulfatase A
MGLRASKNRQILDGRARQMLSRRSFLSSSALAAVTHGQSRTVSTPNIVYVLADDLGWGDLHCYNSLSGIPTPNLDRLAAEGMRFTDMHSPSAVCTPTRYGILTGRYCWRTELKKGVLWGYSPNLIDEGRLTVPALLKKHGYYTAGVGKWHLGLGSGEKTDYSKALKPGPLDHGFDYYFGIPASLDMEPYVYVENDRATEQPSASTPGSTTPRGVFWRGGPKAPKFDFRNVLPTLINRATSIVEERARRKDVPWFLYLPLTAPHTPWLPASANKGQSKAGDYGDFVVAVDEAVGSILRVLDETKQTDNTLFIFTSDNGADWKEEDKEKYAHRANAHWRGEKADIWEAGHRIPFMARWPKHIRAGTASSHLGCLTDLFATVADVVGAVLPDGAGEDSFSLTPALFHRTVGPVRKSVVHHSSEGMFAIREKDWKLVAGLGSGGFSKPQRLEPGPGDPIGQLYNLRQDPAEKQNLYAKHPDVVQRLTQLLQKVQSDGRSRPVVAAASA